MSLVFYNLNTLILIKDKRTNFEQAHKQLFKNDIDK